jgi:hypothetical protein
MECFGKLKLGCRGCEYLPTIGGKPSGSLMVITLEPPIKPWERIKKDVLMPLPVQMLETLRDSLLPVDPVIKRSLLFGALITTAHLWIPPIFFILKFAWFPTLIFLEIWDYLQDHD